MLSPCQCIHMYHKGGVVEGIGGGGMLIANKPLLRRYM